MSLFKLLNLGRVLLTYAKQRRGHRFRSLDDRADEEDISGEIVVITGANAGIGKVLCLEMAKRNATIVMACRDLRKAEKVIAEIKQVVPDANLILVKLDLADMESVRACAKGISEKVSHIKLLICSAGYMAVGDLADRTKDGFEKHLATNHLGHFLLTNLLLDLVKKGAPSRIVVVGSAGHQLATLNLNDLNMEKDTSLGFSNFRPYFNSKLCNMLFARELSKRLEGQGVNVYTLCPGLVDTGLLEGLPMYNILTLVFWGAMPIVGCTPEQGAETIMYCALSVKCAEESGKVYQFGKCWKEADEDLDNEKAYKLWEVSEQLVGLKPKSFSVGEETQA